MLFVARPITRANSPEAVIVIGGEQRRLLCIWSDVIWFYIVINSTHTHTFTRNNGKLPDFELEIASYCDTHRHTVVSRRLLHNNRIKCTKTEIPQSKSRLLVRGIVIGFATFNALSKINQKCNFGSLCDRRRFCLSAKNLCTTNSGYWFLFASKMPDGSMKNFR